MTQNEVIQYRTMLHLLSCAFAGIVGVQYKRHMVNSFLPFGLRKDDVKLEALKDTSSYGNPPAKP